MATLEGADACGRVLAALEEAGLDNSTIVIFTADNGAEIYAYARDAAFDHWSSAPFRKSFPSAFMPALFW